MTIGVASSPKAVSIESLCAQLKNFDIERSAIDGGDKFVDCGGIHNDETAAVLFIGDAARKLAETDVLCLDCMKSGNKSRPMCREKHSEIELVG